jgi:hypothetical protein
MNQAVDEVRRAEGTRLKAKRKDEAKQLKNMRWSLLRKGSRVRGRARKKLNALIASKLDTARAWELKEAFQHFWKYKSPLWAGASSMPGAIAPCAADWNLCRKSRVCCATTRNCCSTGFAPKASFQTARSRASTTKPVW